MANEIDVPSDCQDLNNLGYTLNGLFLVKNKQAANSNRLEVVSCDFQADVSSSSSLSGETKNYFMTNFFPFVPLSLLISSNVFFF